MIDFGIFAELFDNGGDPMATKHLLTGVAHAALKPIFRPYDETGNTTGWAPASFPCHKAEIRCRGLVIREQPWSSSQLAAESPKNATAYCDPKQHRKPGRGTCFARTTLTATTANARFDLHTIHFCRSHFNTAHLAFDFCTVHCGFTGLSRLGSVFGKFGSALSLGSVLSN
jgi:hypothetical protein